MKKPQPPENEQVSLSCHASSAARALHVTQSVIAIQALANTLGIKNAASKAPVETLKTEKYTTFEIADILRDMVDQNCRDRDGVYSSGYIGAHADAIQMLCDLGLMEVVSERNGRFIEARMARPVIEG